VASSHGNACGEGAGAVYRLGFIGAVIYWCIASAASFWDEAHGLFQAIVWPAYLAYDVLRPCTAS
jgi:hypothetical protein